MSSRGIGCFLITVENEVRDSRNCATLTLILIIYHGHIETIFRIPRRMRIELLIRREENAGMGHTDGGVKPVGKQLEVPVVGT